MPDGVSETAGKGLGDEMAGELARESGLERPGADIEAERVRESGHGVGLTKTVSIYPAGPGNSESAKLEVSGGLRIARAASRDPGPIG